MSDPQTTQITYNSNGNSPFSPLGPFNLTNTGQLQISFSGFPRGSTFTLLTLQSTTTATKVVHFPAQPGDTPDIFAITPNGLQPANGLVITITDKEDPAANDAYNLALTGATGTGSNTWNADPEVINKPGG